MPTTENIIDSIEKRLRDLNAEIEALSVARATLASRNGQASAPSATERQVRTSRGSGTKRRAGRARRELAAVPAERLELLLSDAGGLTTTALADRANADRDRVLALLRELEAAGRVRRSGQRRATRWHAITDEDRIRQRAAELAALAKGRV